MIEQATQIVQDPEIRAGKPTIVGTRVGVHDVVSYARLYGGDLERVRSEGLPHLSVGQLQPECRAAPAAREPEAVRSAPPSPANKRDLPRGDRRHLQQAAQRRSVGHRVRLAADVELSDRIAPAKQLAPEGSARLYFDGQADEAEDTLVGQLPGRRVGGRHQLCGTVHLVADH